jgi:hypothetical protein
VIAFGGFAQGLADQVPLAVLLVEGGVLLAALLLVAGLLTRRFWLPVVTRLGFGTRYHWFAASSFFAVLGGDAAASRICTT